MRGKSNKKQLRLLRRFATAIFVLLTFVAGSLNGLFVPPAHAAVPVFVVGFDAHTDFEVSLELFLYNLKIAKEQFDFDLALNLAQRGEDFTAAFELQKIEKAREDVNKLMQEAIQELEDYGTILDGPIPSANDENLEDSNDENLGDSMDFSLSQTDILKPSLLKGSRIIARPLEYLLYEPAIGGQLAMLCYYNYVILDQMGLLFPEGEEDAAEKEKATFAIDGIQDAAEVSPEEMADSVKRLWEMESETFLRTAAAFNISQEVFGNIVRVFIDWQVGEGDNVKKNCNLIYETFGLLTPEKAKLLVGQFQMLPQGGSAKGAWLEGRQQDWRREILLLPTLGKTVVNRPFSAVTEELSAADKGVNSINGIRDIGLDIMTTVTASLAKVNELNFTAGQGIRPENLYYNIEGPESRNIPFNTGYVISPAAILLQKMQAATQAQFDLAQKGFMYLTADSPQEKLAAYNLGWGAPTDGLGPENDNPNQEPDVDPATGRPFMTFYDNSVTNFETLYNGNRQQECFHPSDKQPPAGCVKPIPSTIQPPAIGKMLGWLAPKPPMFASVEFGKDDPLPGLPAPWEDKHTYTSLGTAEYGGYTVKDYILDPATGYQPADEGDNIEIDRTGRDYATNDWYDRVLEMYEPDDPQTNRSFTMKDWECYLETWFTRVNPKDREPTNNDEFASKCADRLGDSY